MDAIISKAEGSNVAGLYGELRSYLEPLNGLLGSEGFPEQIHGLAKRYVPFLGRFWKVSCQNLAHGISASETEQKRAEEMFRAQKFALDCLDALRPCVVGNSHEMRHWMVRSLMSWKRFTEAREECWVALHKLKVNVFCKDAGVSLRKIKEKENEDHGVDLCGELAETANSRLVELMLGLVTDFIICTGESNVKGAVEYRQILVLIDQLVPWQRVSDKNTIEKHRNMLFRALRKCVLFMASEPSHFDPKLTRTFVFLALDNCACSSMKDRFVGVTCGICRQLVSGGPDRSSIVVDICKLAVNTLFKGPQLALGTSSSESISELVSDACARSVVLVDVLHRIGSPLIKEIITDILTHWSSADSRLSSLDNRRALVKHWVKIVSDDTKDMELNEASIECLTLYEVLLDKSSVWPLETLAVLLEEELLAFANIETELSSLIQKRIIKLLLEDVYVTKESSLERSRVLLEQCKAARLIGSDGLDKSIDCLSDAMFLLRKDLDENFCPSGKSYHMDCVRHQLAITYCVHAFCIQELKSDSEVILDDISCALKLWSSIYSSKLPDLNKEQKDWLFDTSVPLLLNISQLLALKGFISPV